jgi:hypothetical protein
MNSGHLSFYIVSFIGLNQCQVKVKKYVLNSIYTIDDLYDNLCENDYML